jgi:hypothetical protein
MAVCIRRTKPNAGLKQVSRALRARLLYPGTVLLFWIFWILARRFLGKYDIAKP